MLTRHRRDERRKLMVLTFSVFAAKMLSYYTMQRQLPTHFVTKNKSYFFCFIFDKAAIEMKCTHRFFFSFCLFVYAVMLFGLNQPFISSKPEANFFFFSFFVFCWSRERKSPLGLTHLENHFIRSISLHLALQSDHHPDGHRVNKDHTTIQT